MAWKTCEKKSRTPCSNFEPERENAHLLHLKVTFIIVFFLKQTIRQPVVKKKDSGIVLLVSDGPTH